MGRVATRNLRVGMGRGGGARYLRVGMGRGGAPVPSGVGMGRGRAHKMNRTGHVFFPHANKTRAAATKMSPVPTDLK